MKERTEKLGNTTKTQRKDEGKMRVDEKSIMECRFFLLVLCCVNKKIVYFEGFMREIIILV
jgi:hypothetical protein